MLSEEGRTKKKSQNYLFSNKKMPLEPSMAGQGRGGNTLNTGKMFCLHFHVGQEPT